MEHTIATSADGSNTLQLTRFNETYHSRNGAYTEAQHIYIQCGVEYLYTSTSAQCINIYDAGMGTALNCLLSWVWQQQLLHSGKPYPQIAYYGIEKYPIPPHEAMQMNYPHVIVEHLNNTPDSNLARVSIKQEHTQQKINPQDAREIISAFEKIHMCSWENNIEITPGFILHKSHRDIKELTQQYFRDCLYKGVPSVIYYDTFSPAIQPELWYEAIFRAIAGGCASGSTLVSYCSKGTVKQALRSAGFTLERLAGPPGKRHILRATL